MIDLGYHKFRTDVNVFNGTGTSFQLSDRLECHEEQRIRPGLPGFAGRIRDRLPRRPAKRPVKVDDMHAFHDVRDLQISPDGKWVAYTLSYGGCGGR